MAGIDFQTEITRAEELAGRWTPRELCLLNAERKAVEVASRFPDCVVLGADTVVSLEGQVFGKPGDFHEARAMLERLCGRVHEVLTGVCLVRSANGNSPLCRIHAVKFRSRQTVDLEDYLRRSIPSTKREVIPPKRTEDG
jgi:septum formation protein